MDNQMYGTPRFDKANIALRNVISHESLPKRSALKYLRFWMKPSFTPWVSWTIFQDEKSAAWYVRRITWHPADPDIDAGITTYAAEANLPTDHATQLQKSLSQLSLRPFPIDNRLGLDGDYFGIEQKESLTGTTIEWWCSPPEGLEPLAKWLSNASKAVESVLPASTHQIDNINF